MFVACARTLISFKAYQRLVSAMEFYHSNPSWMVPLLTLEGVLSRVAPWKQGSAQGE
jgi:hypothetical protein